MNNDGLTLNQLAERNAVLVSEVEKLRTERELLAAENVGLKAAFSPEEIPAEAVDAFMDTAVMDHDWNDTSEWSWVENETEVIRAVLDALKPETPATDRIYAGIKADGVEQAANECYGAGYICETLLAYAQQLREGVK